MLEAIFAMMAQKEAHNVIIPLFMMLRLMTWLGDDPNLYSSLPPIVSILGFKAI